MIEDDTPLTMYRKGTLKNFMQCENPYDFIKKFNCINIEDKDYFEQIKGFAKLPEDFEESLKDLKVLSKK